MSSSKARKRAKRRPKKLDAHHFCWPKNEWNHGYLKAIREHWYFKAIIPKYTLHPLIHKLITGSPTPDELEAKDALEQIMLLESYSAIHNYDPIEKRLELLINLFSCCSQPTADALTKELDIIRKFYNRPQ